MKALRNIQYDAVDLAIPALHEEMAADKFISLLKETADVHCPIEDHHTSAIRFHQKRSYTRAARNRKLTRSVELFEEFIGSKAGVNPTEALMDDFGAFLIAKDNGNRPKYWQEFVGCIRVLINNFPDTILRRPLMTKNDRRLQDRFSFLTPESQNAISDFLKNGLKVSSLGSSGLSAPSRSLKPLSDMTKNNAIRTTLTALKVLGLNDLRQLTDAELSRFHSIYETQYKGSTAIGYFADMGALYRNLYATHFIPEFPKMLGGQKPINIDTDYVPAAGIAKLQDLSTFDWNDFYDVQDRLISFVLLYDFALRGGEAIRLTVEDIKVTDLVAMDLLADYQKGQNKRDVMLFNFFEQSKLIVSRFLQLRQTQFPKTNALLINTRGERMLEGVLSQRVGNHCDKHGIKTQEGKSVACHRLRHSFGTLNIESIGLALSLNEISERLRHEDTKTTKTIYIDNNPLILEERHRGKIGMVRQRMMGQISQDRISHSNIAQSSCHPMSSQAFPLTDAVCSEDTALDMLAHFRIKLPALQKAAKGDGKVSLRDGHLFYSQAYIEDLKANWISKQYAAEALKMTEKQLWHWLQKNGIETKNIGKASLIRAADIFKGLTDKKRQSQTA